jgi:hypothetical protein
MKAIDPITLDAGAVDGKLAMLINAGTILDELTKVTTAAGMPFLGSSVNISGTGNFPLHFSFAMTKMLTGARNQLSTGGCSVGVTRNCGYHY